jgi:hypothetical protein
MTNKTKCNGKFSKAFSTSLLFAFLFSISFVSSTCSKQKRFKEITYEGFCYHSIATPTPEEGVTVTLSGCGTTFGEVTETCSGQQFEIGKSTTDGSGHFKITGKAARSGSYFVTTVKNNSGNKVNSGHGMDESKLKSQSTIYAYN